MARAEAPIPPSMPYMVDTPPSIPSWRKDFNKMIGYQEFQRAQFKMIQEPVISATPLGELQVDCRTRTGDWQLTVVQDPGVFLFKPPTLNPIEVQDIAELLLIRQSPYAPWGGEKPHADSINFLMRNWKKLRNNLYPTKPNETVGPYRFSEVFVDPESDDRADFVGFGPDGRLFVIEFGTEGKYKQVKGYKKNLENLFSGFNLAISPLAAYYSESQGVKKIRIKPSYNDHVINQDENVKRFFSRQKNEQRVGFNPGLQSSFREFEAMVQQIKSSLESKDR